MSEISPVDYDRVFDKIKMALKTRGEKHGFRPFNSNMEILGVTCEEYHEFIEAVRGKENWRAKQEAIDIIVPLIHWIATDTTKSLE